MAISGALVFHKHIFFSCIISAPGPDSKNCQKSSVPRKIEFRKKSQSRQDCFSAPVDSILDDFDFEKNLALFDKKAVFEEIENCNPEVVKVSDKKPTKYRCDENVLQSGPVILQQIKVPSQSERTFVTGEESFKTYIFIIERLKDIVLHFLCSCPSICVSSLSCQVFSFRKICPNVNAFFFFFLLHFFF